MSEQAEIKLTIRRKRGGLKMQTIQTEILPYNRSLAAFAYNNHLYFAGKVETKEGHDDYYTAEIPEE